MKGILSPSTAASIATRVYDVHKSTDFKAAFHAEFRMNFKITNNQIQGTSGGLINQLLNRSSGFALTAEGTSPQFKKHHIIGIRGTKMSSPSDWLTNFHIGITNGPKNLAVHAGFQKSFRSLRPELNKYITEKKPRCLHIVGHSLGGAIAELTAIWASERGIATKLYTFGAPRVILRDCVHRAAVNVDHYRVTHGADPVPCVPVWPFTHTVGDYQTAMNSGAFFSKSAHSMDEPTPGYLNTVSAYKDYKSMGNTLKTIHHKHTLLKYEQRHQASFSQRWQQIITDALITMLKLTGQYALIASLGAGSVGLSFYDVVARCLYESIEKYDEFEDHLRGVLGHMLVFVGKGTHAVKEITQKFIRWVLGLMIKTLYTTAKQAIERVT